MKRTKLLLPLAAAAIVLISSCQKLGDFLPKKSGDHAAKGNVYTLSNGASGNEVIQYVRDNDGKLSYKTSYETGGSGTGGGLGNQGALVFGPGNHLLFGVNAASNTISCFAASSWGLSWLQTVPSGGTMPVSIAVHGRLLYVLNAGSPASISGFTISGKGLTPIPNSTRPLSGDDVGPAQISFTDNGQVLVITEKATSLITTYTVENDGSPGDMHTLSSASPTPFGFAPGRNGLIVVSEANGGMPGVSALSSYRVHNNGMVDLITGPVPAGQTAACWVVMNDSGKLAYTTNTGDGNVSSYSINYDGSIDVAAAIAGVTGPGTTPIDAALAAESRFLYVLDAGTEMISAFKTNADGTLTKIQDVSGLPDGANGLAAQ